MEGRASSSSRPTHSQKNRVGPQPDSKFPRKVVVQLALSKFFEYFNPRLMNKELKSKTSYRRKSDYVVIVRRFLDNCLCKVDSKIQNWDYADNYSTGLTPIKHWRIEASKWKLSKRYQHFGRSLYVSHHRWTIDAQSWDALWTPSIHDT